LSFAESQLALCQYGNFKHALPVLSIQSGRMVLDSSTDAR
jgi:hypothetical protein